MTEITEALAQAAADAAEVVVTKTGGTAYQGTPVLVEPGVYKIATGRRGRPAVVKAVDVARVSPLDAA